MGLFSGGTEIINNGELLEGGIPTATIVPWTTASVPSGFLECAGAAVSRSTYAALFAIVGTTYGAGDGSTTFNLPNLQDNVAVGKSPTKTVGTTGGANTVTPTGNIAGSTANATLSTAQLASHSHSGSATPDIWFRPDRKSESNFCSKYRFYWFRQWSCSQYECKLFWNG
jgi:hypothetical protein